MDKAKTINGGVNYILGKSVAEHELPDNEKTQNVYMKEALLLKQALSLCGSLVDERTRLEAAFFESVEDYDRPVDVWWHRKEIHIARSERTH